MNLVQTTWPMFKVDIVAPKHTSLRKCRYLWSQDRAVSLVHICTGTLSSNKYPSVRPPSALGKQIREITTNIQTKMRSNQKENMLSGTRKQVNKTADVWFK